MNPLSAFVIVTAATAHEILTSENLVIISNFLLVAATLLAVVVTVRSENKTVQKVVRQNNKLLVTLLGPLISPLIPKSQGEHRKDEER